MPRLHLVQARAVGDPGPARAAAAVRDLRLLAAGRGRAPAVRRGRPRRAALVRPPRRLPHRGARPGQGADGEEHRDRAGRREGRVLLQAAARPRPTATRGWPRAWPATRPSSPGCSTSPTTSSTARPCRRRTSSATTATTPTSSSPPTRAPRRSPTSPTGSRRTTASGSATRSPAAARSATTTRRWASPPAAPGSRCSGTSASAASTARPRTSPASASATCRGDVFGNGMLCSEHTRLVAAFDHRDIFLDPTPTRRRRTPSGSGCSTLPRSSWQDYDKALISEGGGVFPRSLKSIPLTPQMRDGARASTSRSTR